MSNQLDIILFGASGYTGTHCIVALHKLTKSHGHSFTWGIAGRSARKLNDALKECENEIGEDLSAVPLTIADVEDFESLKNMTAGAKVLINCCGPYRFYGEPVVKACIETKTHYVDVTGEPQFMETMEYKYHKTAQEKGIYIVSACGFDSIPADLGVLLLQQKFEGTINSVETYLHLAGSARPNFATYESAVYGVGDAKELGKLRRKLYTIRLPVFRPKLKYRGAVHKSEITKTWCVPFIGSDRSVVQRTQRYLFEKKKVRPVQIHTYTAIQSFYNLFLMIFLGLVFSFLAKYKLGRSILLKYPSLFTAGIVTHERPSKTTAANSQFGIIFQAVGWSEKLAATTDEFKTAPNKKMRARISGSNPGYGLTSSLVTLAAITILSEEDKLPKGGGVYTPGVAFQDTSFMKLAEESGLYFQIVE